MDKYTKLLLEDAEKVEALIRVIDIFREYDTTFPASYIAAFLLVAMKPGKGSSEYARDLGLAQAVTSRLMLEIGQKSRTGEEGLGLLDSSPDGQDLRVRRVFLTNKGRGLLRRVLAAMKKLKTPPLMRV
jgi:DNA-binding MarR family transcriptional regulator